MDPETRRDTRVCTLLMLFGVAFPGIALGVELGTNASRGIYFDPIPTWWHVLLVAAVPLANLHAIALLRGHGAGQAVGSLRATALALAICGFYTLLYLPILPLSLLAVPFYGFGLLPYAPLLAALATGWGRSRVAMRFPDATARARGGRAALAGLALVLLLEVPGWVTQVGFGLAGSHDESTQRRGIALLRALGSDASMRRALHYGRGNANLTGHLVLGSGLIRALSTSRLEREQHAATYYRVTGRSPLAAEPPPSPGTESGMFGGWRRFDRPGLAQGLALEASRLDGTLHPGAALAYLEWTLVLRNERSFPQECRAQVQLPPDAVVTRATLWVNGEPRDAAFGPKGAVIEAYEKVTRTRRDPLLVTAAGHDRVAIRCFPVPERGRMKIRLGMTAPLLLAGDRGALQLPELVDPNFRVDPGVERSVWIDSRAAFASAPEGLATRPGRNQSLALEGTLPEGEPAWVEIERPPAREIWAADAVSPNGVAIAQRVERGAPAVSRLVVVVDGSVSMAQHAGEIADALERLPADIALGILVASDEPVELLAPGDAREPALYLLRRFGFAGGQDDAPALELAADRASAVPGGAVLWIHPPLPIVLEEPLALRRRLERSAHAARWLELQTRPGADALVASLVDVVAFEPVPRRGRLAEDLAHALDRLSGAVPSFVAVRRRSVPPEGVVVAPPDSAHSAHLSRLWARDQTLALLHGGGAEARERAATLASLYRVVTPVSGAVVLETDRQYEENQLAAPKAGADEALAAAGTGGNPFPSIGGPLAAIPEPGTGALTALGLTLLAAWRRHRRARR